MTTPRLIQRIKTRKAADNKARGIDRDFEFDYMGSAEFEFGALPAALKTMRKCADALVVKRIVTLVGPKLWFVGSASDLPDVCAWLNAHLLAEHVHHLKEPTFMRTALGLEQDFDPGCDGWWALDASSPWAVFTTQASAELWLAGVRGGDAQ